MLPKLAATRKQLSENNKVGQIPFLTLIKAVKQSKKNDTRRPEVVEVVYVILLSIHHPTICTLLVISANIWE